MTIRCVLMLLWFGAVSVAAQPVNFNRDIRPLLADNCFRCHGPDAQTREAGLRLDLADSATAELDSGNRAVVAGNPDASELVSRLRSPDEDMRMPPSDLGPPLQQDEIKLLERWIAEGATFERHWSLQPIRRTTAARSQYQPSWIDHFIKKKLDEVGIEPNPEADRETLIRRASLALTGLPPTIPEVDAFLEDRDSDSYLRLIERLLASPRFGERWARVWLDSARYADSAGYAQDPARSIWRYRDWVIDAYNRNQPFDEFTVDQIAGDLLPEPTNEQLLATAFHRNTMTNSEGGTDDEEFRNAAVVDRVNTTMQVWMGLTMGCAQCHDHKYDDITQQEYYRLFAILNNTEDADRGDESPWLEEFTEEQKTRRAALLARLNDLDESHERTQDERKELEKQLQSIRGVRTPVMRELQGDGRRETRIHVRGNFRVTSEAVQPGVPKSLHPIPENPSRLDLADWLVADNNPLTARVIVNRYWELLFGQGLVTTSEDFGIQGELPWHPALLDYLAAELMRHEWDTKWLIKEIVTSTAYRRSSQGSPRTMDLDPTNRWLGRGPRFRLPAEMIRDQALAVSGLLSTKMRGPSVRPPRPKLGLRAAFGGSTDWEASQGEDRFRRGLYTSWRRTTPYPSMTTFDAPSREFCTVRRIRTNTPLQALVTLNDPVFVEAAQELARRVLREADTWDDQIEFAYRLVLARLPEEQESRRLRALFDETLDVYQADQEQASQMAFDPRGSTHEFNLPELATWTVISNVLLNLDETLAPR